MIYYGKIYGENTDWLSVEETKIKHTKSIDTVECKLKCIMLLHRNRNFTIWKLNLSVFSVA